MHLVDLVVAVPDVGVPTTDHGGDEDDQRTQRHHRLLGRAPLGLAATPGLGPAARRIDAGPQRTQARFVGHARTPSAPARRCASPARAFGSRTHLAPERGQTLLVRVPTATLVGGAIRPVARRTTVRHGEERYQAPPRRWGQVATGVSRHGRRRGSAFVLVPGVAGLLELQRQRCIARVDDGAVDQDVHHVRFELLEEAAEVGDGQQPHTPLGGGEL